MASTRNLIRRLRRAGFLLVRHGANHDIYERSSNGDVRRVVVPRHREIPTGTYFAILRQAGLH